MRSVTQLAFGPTEMTVQDDRILPITRLIGAIIAPILLGAFLILWGFPGRTTELFAWTIRPDMTPIVMGAGYGTGVYFFYRVVTVEHWHRVAHVFPGIAVFTWMMAAATALHWENFNHDHVTFFLWTVLYVASPIVVPGIWLINRRTAVPAIESSERSVPIPIRWLAGVSGVAITLTSVVLFFVPQAMVANWAWQVSPLTTRILLGWFALLGVVNIVVAFEPRWTGWRIVCHSQLIGLALVLIGAARAWGDFDPTHPYTWAVLGGMAVYLGLVATLYAVMEYRRQHPEW